MAVLARVAARISDTAVIGMIPAPSAPAAQTGPSVAPATAATTV